MSSSPLPMANLLFLLSLSLTFSYSTTESPPSPLPIPFLARKAAGCTVVTHACSLCEVGTGHAGLEYCRLWNHRARTERGLSKARHSSPLLFTASLGAQLCPFSSGDLDLYRAERGACAAMAGEKKVFSFAEVAKHSAVKDCWLVISDKGFVLKGLLRKVSKFGKTVMKAGSSISCKCAVNSHGGSKWVN